VLIEHHELAVEYGVSSQLFSEMKAAQREAGELFRSQRARKWRAPQVDDTIPM
jgi:hypothetical protein